MRHAISFKNLEGQPLTGLAVELYNWQAGSPYYSSKIGDFSEVPNTGEYYIDITATVRATVIVDSVVQTAFIGIALVGNLDENFIPDGSITTAKLVDGAVTTAKLADGSVTPVKTTFVEDF